MSLLDSKTGGDELVKSYRTQHDVRIAGLTLVSEPLLLGERAHSASRSPSVLAWARTVFDLSAILSAIAIAYPLRFSLHLLSLGAKHPPRLSDLVLAEVVWIVALLSAMYVNRLYDEDTLFAGGRELGRVARSALEALAVFCTIFFLLRNQATSRGWYVFVVVLTVGLVSGERYALARFLAQRRSRGLLTRPAAIITNRREINDEPDRTSIEEFEVIATLSPEDIVDPDLGGAARARLPSGTAVIIEDHGLDDEQLWQIVLRVGEWGCPTFLQMRLPPIPRDRLSTRELNKRSIIKVSPPALTGLRSVEKRLMDVVITALVIPLLLPVILAISSLIVLTSGRPILYRQQRVGRDGKPFAIWKFRTMKLGAEAETGPVWSAPNDGRCTKLGRLLRRTSADEIPQLWNVLTGGMSLVGPRPERPFFVEQLSSAIPLYQSRHRIRPGLTGLAQARGLRGQTSMYERVSADNYYIEHWSLGLDFAIIARTVVEVIRGEHAY